jgi:hypothetical protein
VVVPCYKLLLDMSIKVMKTRKRNLSISHVPKTMDISNTTQALLSLVFDNRYGL